MGQTAYHAGQWTKEEKRGRAVSKLDLDAINKEERAVRLGGLCILPVSLPLLERGIVGLNTPFQFTS